MYALVEDNNITKIITNPKSLVIGDVRYPAKIFSLWSKSELNAIGIYEIITDSTNKKDEKWYVNTNESYSFAEDQVTRSWGTATAKAHEDTLFTAQDETDGLGTEGNVKVEGLKTILIKNIKKETAVELSKTDWYITRNTEKSIAIPSAISTHRDAVRTKQAEMETAIINASDTPALETLYTYVNTGTEENPVYERPLGELPTLES
jgi:hypothetical protein|tara:strand:- start:183 stop:800 length:618 start_codon:yes stop_codon:yes gene_type:complete